MKLSSQAKKFDEWKKVGREGGCPIIVLIFTGLGGAKKWGGGAGGLKSSYGKFGGKPQREDFYGVELTLPDAMNN